MRRIQDIPRSLLPDKPPPDDPSQSQDDIITLLDHAWELLCTTYEVKAPLPELESLLEGADLHTPKQAAAMVVANMLAEIIEDVGRFSPYYKDPASEYGLVLVRNRKTNCTQWVLSSEAARHWRAILIPLASAIKDNIGLILAANLVEDIERNEARRDRCITAICACTPPNAIHVNRSVIATAQIICDACQEPYRPRAPEVENS